MFAKLVLTLSLLVLSSLFSSAATPPATHPHPPPDEALSFQMQIGEVVHTLTFSPLDEPNLGSIALDFVSRQGLAAGEGCTDQACTAGFVEGALRQLLAGKEPNRVDMIEQEILKE